MIFNRETGLSETTRRGPVAVSLLSKPKTGPPIGHNACHEFREIRGLTSGGGVKSPGTVGTHMKRPRNSVVVDSLTD